MQFHLNQHSSGEDSTNELPPPLGRLRLGDGGHTLGLQKQVETGPQADLQLLRDRLGVPGEPGPMAEAGAAWSPGC